jgi:hypothetical protein
MEAEDLFPCILNRVIGTVQQLMHEKVKYVEKFRGNTGYLLMANIERDEKLFFNTKEFSYDKFRDLKGIF